jgi:hypothetical protein
MVTQFAVAVGGVPNSLEFEGIKTELVEVLGVPAFKCNAVGLSAKTRPEDRPAGFPLLSLTRSAGFE